jgi:serine/threonine-protein kinase
VVGDFGIARAISRVRSDPQHGERSTTLTATGVSLGTPTYMSPEQASGDRPLDGRSDIYALGCVLFEMLAGQPPFTGPTAESVVRQHTLAPPPALSALRESVPSAVVSAIGRALAKSPGDRFQTALQFAAALEASGETADTTLSVWARALRRARKALIALTALTLMTAGVIAASSLWRGDPVPVIEQTTQLTHDPQLEVDDPSRPFLDNFATDDGQLYFTVSDFEGDLWMLSLRHE